jgi:hypothetical protein
LVADDKFVPVIVTKVPGIKQDGLKLVIAGDVTKGGLQLSPIPIQSISIVPPKPVL